jgi:hypothetical protein
VGGRSWPSETAPVIRRHVVFCVVPVLPLQLLDLAMCRGNGQNVCLFGPPAACARWSTFYKLREIERQGTPHSIGVWSLDARGLRIVAERSIGNTRRQRVANDLRWSERLSQGA